jgi:hypothetical protein
MAATLQAAADVEEAKRVAAIRERDDADDAIQAARDEIAAARAARATLRRVP